MAPNPYEAFRSGDRPDHVFIFLSESAIEDAPTTPGTGEELDGGRGYVLRGTAGRTAFADATRTDVMAFARAAMDAEGTIEPTLERGTCPACGSSSTPIYLFAFAEEQNEAVGGRYAEGAVVHAYARCPCGTDYSDRWVVDSDPADASDDGS